MAVAPAVAMAVVPAVAMAVVPTVAGSEAASAPASACKYLWKEG